jgi:hypothetical protein
MEAKKEGGSKEERRDMVKRMICDNKRGEGKRRRKVHRGSPSSVQQER